MADSAFAPGMVAVSRVDPAIPRHTATVRVTHWIATLCFFALLVSGIELIISHPRFYWGEEGNVNTASLFDIPIPASRSKVNTGYNYTLPDQNGWSRYLHFQTAWALGFTALVYVGYGLISGHYKKRLLPSAAQLAPTSLGASIGRHIKSPRAASKESASYNVLQRLTYSIVIFLLFPVMIWTGLAMSPGLVAAFPFFVDSVGGHQSARTIHFFVTLALVAFLVIHVAMICLAGFRRLMRGMITGAEEVS